MCAVLDIMPAVAAPFAAMFTGERTPTAAGRPINHVCLAMDGVSFAALQQLPRGQ